MRLKIPALIFLTFCLISSGFSQPASQTLPSGMKIEREDDYQKDYSV